MGFCDVVGMATSYVKNDFGLSETLAGFIPSAVFFWFLLLSVPTAIVMNKIGRKRTVLVSMVITIVGMMLPLFLTTWYLVWSLCVFRNWKYDFTSFFKSVIDQCRKMQML